MSDGNERLNVWQIGVKRDEGELGLIYGVEVLRGV